MNRQTLEIDYRKFMLSFSIIPDTKRFPYPDYGFVLDEEKSVKWNKEEKERIRKVYQEEKNRLSEIYSTKINKYKEHASEIIAKENGFSKEQTHMIIDYVEKYINKSNLFLMKDIFDFADFVLSVKKAG